MTPSLDDARAASLPASALGALADLRGRPGIGVTLDGEAAWVRWEEGDGETPRRLLAVPGVSLYDRRGGLWYPHGRRLPAFGLPLDSGRVLSLERAVTPEPIRPVPTPGRMPAPVGLRLVRDDRARPASALHCAIADLAAWADAATTAELAGISAARDGERVILRGRALPAAVDGGRSWGDRVLTRLGFRPDPALPEAAILGALGVDEGDLLVLDEAACEVVPSSAFGRLTRAGIRLALTEGPH